MFFVFSLWLRNFFLWLQKKLKATEQYGNGGILFPAASGWTRRLGASLWLPDVETWRAPAVL